MSLFRGTIRPPAVLSDEAVERYLAAIRAGLTPDPLFRRRLRGVVMNRYVARREGMVAVPRNRSMGRLGRAVLYASFTLALSTTTVLAASQEALPGDPLYALKRQVEDLRVQILPADLHDDLAAYALAERIDELARLAVRGDWARVESLAITVEHDFAAFVARADTDRSDSNDKYLIVLNGLLARLPDPAREAVEGVIDRASVRDAAPPERGARGGGTPATGNRGGSDGTSPSVGGPADNASGGSDRTTSAVGGPADNDEGGAGTTDQDPRVTPEPRPTRGPRPDPAPRPSHEPSESSSSSSNPSDGSHGIDSTDD